MKPFRAPMLLPAAAFGCGSLAAFNLPLVATPWWLLLALLGLALRRPAGILLAAFACGALAAILRCGLPDSPLAGADLERPVEALVRIDGHWAPALGDEAGWTAAGRMLRLRQDRFVKPLALDLVLQVPGAEEPPPFGATLRVKGYLARSPRFANRWPVPPGPWRLRVKSRLLMAEEEGPGPAAALSGALRRRVDRAYAEAASPGGLAGQGRSLARALVLGDVSGLPIPWKRALRLTGIYHLLSISGLHVALVAGLVWLLAGWLPRAVRLLLMLAAVALYVLLVGPIPALVRSAVMACLGVAALLAERPPAPANGLAWAVIVLVLQRPDAVLEPGFQLTASATAGLLTAAPLLAARWRRRLPPWLATALAASVAAELFTLPWALPRFFTLPLLAPLLNLVAVPWTAVALLASLAWTGTALVAPRAAGWLLPALDAVAAPFSWLARLRPDCVLSVPLLVSPAAAWMLAGGLGLLLLARPRRASIRAGLLAMGLTCAIASVWRPLTAGRDRGPELAMLDVGQGDSILLRDGRAAILVDGGGWDHGDIGGRVLVPALLGEGVRRLDALVMTHPDHDHCGGLVDIAAYLPVREVWMGPGWQAGGCAGQLMDLPGVRLRILAQGRRARVGSWRLLTLHPAPDERRATNERSLVLRAEAHGRSVLLTGDVEAWAEGRVVACCARQAHVDVLKVAHHGSKTSSTEPFLDAVAPRLALISAGVRNLYHHPSPTVLDRLAAHGVRILRTDRDGMVLLRFPGDGRTHLELPGAPR